jgi:flagellar protein FlaI
VADPTPAGRWAIRHVPPTPRSITELIILGTIDAHLAATLWVLIEGGVPVVVAGDGPGVGASTMLEALVTFAPADVQRVELAGADEDFAWLPHAGELGWDRRTTRPAGDNPISGSIRPDRTMIIAAELSDRLPSDTWGEQARIAVRAAALGYGLGATIRAGSLEGVFVQLSRPPVSLTDDELSRLGVVLIVRRVGPNGSRRVVAAHYVRPVARDEHGHVQRLGPAVLATWDQALDRFEDFGWGIIPELAMRVGRRAGDFEIAVDRRRELLERLAREEVVAVDDVRRAIDADVAASDAGSGHGA